MPEPTRRPRVTRTATVVRTEQVSRDLVRVHLRGDELRTIDPSEATDRYVKLVFGDVTRTYTIRSLDLEAGEMAIDFVVHGDQGLAGPWARDARPGDTISFRGPGGAWGPRADADVHLLVGDESAIPAIAAALDAMPADARVRAYLEVADAGSHVPLRELDGLDVTWVHRDEAGGRYGEGLSAAVRSDGLPGGDLEAFVHGNAEMIKDLRRYLFVEQGVPRGQVSISGYWRPGQDEDAWQAGKREFNAAMEAEQDGPRAG